MNFMEFFLTTFGTTATTLLAVGFLVRTLIAHLLTKDISRFKSDLEKIAFEHQVRYSKLHEIRAQTTANLYASIVNLANKANKFVAAAYSSSETEKNLNELWVAVDEFKDVFEKNRIYYPEEICIKIDTLNETMSDPLGRLIQQMENNPETNHELSHCHSAWVNARYKLDQEAKEIKEEIAIEFRKMLGVGNEIN